MTCVILFLVVAATQVSLFTFLLLLLYDRRLGYGKRKPEQARFTVVKDECKSCERKVLAPDLYAVGVIASMSALEARLALFLFGSESFLLAHI
jgi:hypothetical protein